jgi:TonB family protein
MIRHAAIGALISLLAIALLSCSNKSGKSAPTMQPPVSSRQQPSQKPATGGSTGQVSALDVAATPQLYLLAGTPAVDYSYPVTLYRAEGGRLKAVREVVPQAEGVRSIQAWGNVVFLIHAAQIPRAVTVLHTDEPLHIDDVEINPDYPEYFFAADEAVAEPRPSVFDELMLASRGEFSLPNIKWLSISSGAAAPGPRMKLDSWDEYGAMRLQGEPGGPGNNADFVGAIAGTNLVFAPAWGHPVVIDSLAPSVRDAINETASRRAGIVAASQEYLVLGLEYSYEERFSRKLSNASEMGLFVHDRVRDNWKTIQVEGNRSRSRLFGSWLASIVGMFNPDHKPSPGRENERGVEAFGDYEIAGSKGNDGTARFPLVRGQYDSDGFFPGVLLLQNLEDGRKMRIETGQEDSEILSVSDEVVLYRVNDAVYQANIVGDKLQGAILLAKDEDVPEIHWVFWGPPIKPADSAPATDGSASPQKPLVPLAQIRVDDATQAQRLISEVPPVYPPLARQAGVQGSVVLHALIDKDGKVARLLIVSGDPLLVQAALDAVRQRRYTPAMLNGSPVEVDTTITVSFALDGKKP